MRYNLIGPFVAFLIAGPALADEEFHCPKPGTVVKYSDGGSISFTGQTGLVCEGTSASGKPVRSLLGFTRPDSDFGKNHGEQKLFPWRVGNTFEYDHTADSSHLSSSLPTANEILFYHDDLKIVRQEKLTTQAGPFDTFVIEWHEVIKNHNISGAWMYTLWYAADLGYVIKQVKETRQGAPSNDAASTWEIVSLKLPNQPLVASPTPVPAPPSQQIVAPPAPQNKPTAIPSSVADRLAALKDLLDHKLITPSEYEAKRKAILDAL